MIPEYSPNALEQMNGGAVSETLDGARFVVKAGTGDWKPGRMDGFEWANMAKNWVGDMAERPAMPEVDPTDPAMLKMLVQGMRANMGSPNYNLCTQELYTGYETLAVQGRTVELWRYYKRKTDKEKRPCVVYYHGGGFMGGTPFAVENFCRLLAERADAVVFNVNYALAPEHPFPQGLEDCYAALEHVAQNAAAYGVDAGRIAVSGDSAGGNLSAAVCLKARDENGPKIALQAPIYPVLTMGRSVPEGYRWSEEDFEIEPGTREEPVIRGMMEAIGKPKEDGPALFEQMYTVTEENMDHPYASPMLAKSHAGLPPALISVAEYDGLRPQGEFYARQLARAGVDATLICYRGSTHAFVDRVGLAPQAEDLINEMAAALAAL